MSILKPKKIIVFSLILTGLFLANGTKAQIMPASESTGTTATSTLIKEPMIASTSSSTPNRETPTTLRQRANVNGEQRPALTVVRQNRITNLAANISNRMDAAVGRLSIISQRLEQRIIKMEEVGIEITLAREKLLVAKQMLADASLKLSSIDTLVNGATYSTQPQNDWLAVKERYQETSQVIRQAHFALRESILSLKNPAINTPVTGEVISN